MISLKLRQDPLHRETSKVFSKKSVFFELKPGTTALVGCNGSGKTTVLKCLEDHCKNKSIPVYSYKQLESKDRLAHRLFFQDQMKYLAESFGPDLSEGEAMYHRLAALADDIGAFAADSSHADSAVFTFDSMDSGWSIDQIDDFYDFLVNTLIPLQPKEQDVYVVIAANSYEFARLCDCSIDVQTGHKISFGDYESYRNFILESRKQKEELQTEITSK